MMAGLTIGKLADTANVNVETVRYYQRIGLLPVPESLSGYRQYTDEHMQRLQFIRHAKEAGFTLEEIHSLLHLDAIRDRNRIRELAERRLLDIKQRITDMQKLVLKLEDLVGQCANEKGSDVCCPIVETFRLSDDRLSDGKVSAGKKQ